MNFAIVLRPTAPEQVLHLFSNYLHEPPEGNLVFAFSRSADLAGPFLSCELEHTTEDSKTIHVRLPLDLILSIIEYEGGQEKGLGFLSDLRS